MPWLRPQNESTLQDFSPWSFKHFGGSKEPESMEPMYLREVEEHQGEGPWADGIRHMREAGLPVPQIMHLFAFKTERTQHLAQFTQGVMRGPSPLSPGQRELIAAFTSRRNECPF